MGEGSTRTFTVVMAAYRTVDHIDSAIRSVLGQTRSDLELVVVDDGSDDGTRERAAEYESDSRVRVLDQDHGGAGSARARGIAAGSGRYISLLDSDDVLMPSYLEKMGAALDATPEAGMAYTDAWWLDERSRRVRRASAMAFMHPPEPPPETAQALFDELLERNFFYNSVTLRREVVDAVGPPDSRLRSAIDWEWWLRVAHAGYPAVRVPGRLAIYRLRKESMTSDMARVYTGLRDVCLLVADEYDLPEETRARLRRRAEAHDAEAAAFEGRRPIAGPLRRARHRLALAKTAALAGRHYHAEPPPELRAVFPDLRAI